MTDFMYEWQDHDGHTLGEICDSYGLPHDPEVLHRHLVNNAAAVYGAKDCLIETLTARLDIAVAALKAMTAPDCQGHTDHPTDSPTCPVRSPRRYAIETLERIAATRLGSQS